ncbi:MAG TPA: hypothetical protein VFR38_00740 [Gaiellaceae bacterium]|nr:hypothetical protein [Gaiellaceae bacterium]
MVSVPFGRYREPSSEGVAGNVVIDTNNYHPQRDGHFEELDRGRTTSSELLQAHLVGPRLVKAFNAIQPGVHGGPAHRRVARPHCRLRAGASEVWA